MVEREGEGSVLGREDVSDEGVCHRVAGRLGGDAQGFVNTKLLVTTSTTVLTISWPSLVPSLYSPAFFSHIVKINVRKKSWGVHVETGNEAKSWPACHTHVYIRMQSPLC